MRSLLTRVGVGFGVVAMALVAPAASFAAGTTYDVSPVVSGVTDQITAVLPIVLPILGGLIALGLGIRFAKKHLKTAA